MDARLDVAQKSLRQHVVRPGLGDGALDLLLQTCHADLEELIEIGAEDGQELHPLEQRLDSDPPPPPARGD